MFQGLHCQRIPLVTAVRNPLGNIPYTSYKAQRSQFIKHYIVLSFCTQKLALWKCPNDFFLSQTEIINYNFNSKTQRYWKQDKAYKNAQYISFMEACF